jgi:5-formyltetrahydrofolate cyclo-ligase
VKQPKEAKAALRREAAKQRMIAFRDSGEAACQAALHRFRAAIEVPPGAAIAGYWPIGDEIDPRPILRYLHAAGHRCSLPAVIRQEESLVFRAWRPGAALVPSRHGTRAPGQDAPETVPDLLLVPLLAFDHYGHRLGYGAGYYDRTLHKLRARRAVLAVGLAFAVQEVERIPADDFDQALDWVVTERAAHRFKQAPVN